MQRFDIIEKELVSFVVKGDRYGEKMHVLARSDNYLLIWIPGSLSYADRAWSYSGSALVVLKRKEKAQDGLVICERQPLSNDLFNRHAVILNSLFGPGFNETLCVNHTVVIGNQPVPRATLATRFNTERRADIRRQHQVIIWSLEQEVSTILAA